MASRKEVAQKSEHQKAAVLTQMQYSEALLNKYIENLPSVLENKKERLTEEIQKYLQTKPDSKHIPAAIIMQMLGKDFKSMIGEPMYSATELAMVFEYYQDFICELNMSGIKFPPTRQNFCMFAGLTTSTYSAYLNSNDTNKKIVAQRIEDYINEVNWTAAQNDEQNAYTVEKRAKLKGIGGGYTEAKEDTNINITSQVKSPNNMQELLDKLQSQGLLSDK